MSNSNVDNSNKGTELAKVIRSMIQHEDKLRNNRVTWALIVQGFLIGVTGDLWKTGDNEIIIIMIAIVAIFLLISFRLTVRENDKAINKLVNLWRSKLAEPGVKDIPITGCRLEKDIPYSGKKNLKEWIKDGFLIWNFLPLILILFWIIIAFLVLVRYILPRLCSGL